MANKRKSISPVVASALRADKIARQKARDDAAKQATAILEDGVKAEGAKTADSFVNFNFNMGVGADNALTTSTYGFNPITRNRTLLEWIHRGSWLGGVAIDVMADDMTRAGIKIDGSLDPSDVQKIEEEATRLNVWNEINDCIKWSRLYGGAIGVLLIDGQDPSTPLRLSTIRKGQFCGMLTLDRWMVEPTLNDLVTEYGPDLGNPKYYKVVATAQALSGKTIHYSRCMRLEGIRLSYWQRLTENLWGISVLERLYDRMIAYDSASTGAAQLVYKSYLRTYRIKGMREVIAAGGPALNGLVQYVDMMRRFQSIEGITLLDSEDDYNAESHGAFSGLSDALSQFGQQIAGALQIPLVRLFGQSPAGFSTGESDLRSYYDTVLQAQERSLRRPVVTVYRVMAASLGISIPDGTTFHFNPLWQISETDKATIANSVTTAVSTAEESGIIDRPTALKELRQSSDVTGIFTNITDEQIKEAELEPPPLPEGGEEQLPTEPVVTPKEPEGTPPPAAEEPTLVNKAAT
jgi:uncharacterized protein